MEFKVMLMSFFAIVVCIMIIKAFNDGKKEVNSFDVVVITTGAAAIIIFITSVFVAIWRW